MLSVYIAIKNPLLQRAICEILEEESFDVSPERDRADVILGDDLFDAPLYAPDLLKTLRGRTMRLTCGRYILDKREKTLTQGDTLQTLSLTEKEVDFLACLFKHHPQEIGRDQLLRDVWGYNPDVVETHALETLVYRLRQKIEATPASPTLIVSGDQGYRFGG